MEPLSSALLVGGLSGVGGAIVVWLLRTWIAERIRQDVQHVYAQKLEAYKTELSSHAELQQLRTSLFFEHQRSAFSTLLSKIVETNQKWQSAHYEPGIGMAGPVPSSAYRDLRDAYYANNMHFEEIQAPVMGSLRLTGNDEAADAVSKASEHIDELLLKLKQLHAVLGQRRNGTFHEQRTEVSRYLSMLVGAGTDI